MDNFTYGKRAANLHESDPYWDSDDKVWRKRKDDSFDDEANDDRPDDEKYSNYPLIVIAMMVVLLLLALGLNYIMSHIG